MTDYYQIAKTKNIINQVFGIELNDNLYYQDGRISLAIQSNDEFDKIKSREFPDGFLFFSHFIEVESSELLSYIIISLIADLMTKLWKMDIPAVCACDFEDKLPNSGGYNSKVIPWPH